MLYPPPPVHSSALFGSLARAFAAAALAPPSPRPPPPLRPFNFYLFPEGRNTDVVLNADSIAFLKKHGMDFQKWIYQGVPFVNGEGEVRPTARHASGTAPPPRHCARGPSARVFKTSFLMPIDDVGLTRCTRTASHTP